MRTYRAMTKQEVETIIAEANTAFGDWRRHELSLRADRMRAMAVLLRSRASRLAQLIAEEMGKPVAQGTAELQKCAWVCEFYADHASEFLMPEPVETDALRSYVTFQPLGLVLAVMPWNYPFWQVFRCAAPILMAGNGCVLKHASNVCGCALAIEALFVEAGFPENLFRTILLPGPELPATVGNPLIAAVTLTGSGPAGASVAGLAGRALKKTVLELGGSDPYIILQDADVRVAAELSVKSRLTNAGQSCIAAKRFIVVEALRRDFERLFVELMNSTRMGDPRSEQTEVGPLARKDLRDDIHRQVQQSVACGATCLAGGELPAGQGYFYPPTVLTDVARGMPAFDEELFGPVGAIVPVQTETEAIAAANDTPFGLGAAVFTRDTVRGERIAAQELRAGCCFVNDYVRSDPRLPFGGIKGSGFGRELSRYGMMEFVNTKTVYVGKA